MSNPSSFTREELDSFARANEQKPSTNFGKISTGISTPAAGSYPEFLLRYHDEVAKALFTQASGTDTGRMTADWPKSTPRKALLDEALAIVSKDRNAAYGNPEDNFQNIADYWNSYLTQRAGHATVGVLLSSQDIAHMMILMKMARLATNPSHYDSLLDIAGYAACGNDCRVATADRTSMGCEKKQKT